MSEEKKERTPWQKVVRGFWITLACIGALVVFFVISMIPTEDDDRSDITDNQEYVATVSHNGTVYTYYCTGYTRHLINGSFILINYKGEPTHELFITAGTYFQVKKNPDYKKEYFEPTQEDKEKELRNELRDLRDKTTPKKSV